MVVPPVTGIHWAPSWRLVPSVFPPVSLFERVSEPEDLEAVIAIESMTNSRLRNEIGELHLVPAEERQSGPGTTPIMACFTHLNPDGSRFSDGTFGVYYAAREVDTAVAETKYHREKFMALTNEPAMEIDMRSYASVINTELHDVRVQVSGKDNLNHSALYDPNSYAHSQPLAVHLRGSGSNGIVYNSVRHTGGECVAIFKANIPQPVTQGIHFCFCWDGQCVTDVYTKSL